MNRVYLCEDVTLGEILDFVGTASRDFKVKIAMLTNTDELSYEIIQIAIDYSNKLIEIGIK